MKEKEITSKRDFIKILLIVGPILIVFKDMQSIPVADFFFVIFLLSSILYYFGLPLNSEKYILLISFLVSVSFSILVGISIGLITSIESLRSTFAMFYYTIFFFVLFFSLIETKSFLEFVSEVKKISRR